jgi:hypothetical protein
MKRTRNPQPELSAELVHIERLNAAGASSKAAIRQRIALIAAERNLDPSEISTLMKGRWLPTFDLCQFAKRHRLSFDWLLGGDLKGRLKMARRDQSLPRQIVVDSGGDAA